MSNVELSPTSEVEKIPLSISEQDTSIASILTVYKAEQQASSHYTTSSNLLQDSTQDLYGIFSAHNDSVSGDKPYKIADKASEIMSESQQVFDPADPEQSTINAFDQTARKLGIFCSGSNGLKYSVCQATTVRFFRSESDELKAVVGRVGNTVVLLQHANGSIKQLAYTRKPLKKNQLNTLSQDPKNPHVLTTEVITINEGDRIIAMSDKSYKDKNDDILDVVKASEPHQVAYDLLKLNDEEADKAVMVIDAPSSQPSPAGEPESNRSNEKTKSLHKSESIAKLSALALSYLGVPYARLRAGKNKIVSKIAARSGDVQPKLVSTVKSGEFVNKNKKLLIGIGAVAVGAGLYYLDRKGYPGVGNRKYSVSTPSRIL
jgi:hypothetical protein